MNELDDRIERAVGSRPVAYAPRPGGYSPPGRPASRSAVVGLPPPETAPEVRAVQRRQPAVALDWVDRELLG